MAALRVLHDAHAREQLGESAADVAEGAGSEHAALLYAVCTGSFRVAAALLIVNPLLLRATCKVTVGEASEMCRAKEKTWDALELARLFSS